MAKVTQEGVICLAHPMTVGQYKRMEEKGLDAFKSAPLSNRAKNENAWIRSKFGTGYCFTASVWSGSSKVRSVDSVGGLADYNSGDNDAGLRVALHPIYNPQSKIVKTGKSQTKTAQIWNGKKSKTEKKKSTGTVVTVGGIQYLWLNKKECENGTEKTMDLISTEMVARSVPFDKDGKHNDYAKATELQQQCETVALENCDEEELALLQEGLLAKEDNYQNWTAIEAKTTKIKPSPVKDVYIRIESGELTAEEGKQALQAILDEIKSNGDVEKIEQFTQDLENEHKAYMEIQAAKQAEEKKVQDAYDTAKSTIDDLKFGDDQ